MLIFIWDKKKDNLKNVSEKTNITEENGTVVYAYAVPVLCFTKK